MMTFELIGKVLKDLRKKKQLTISQLAKISGYTQAYISKVENGHIQRPSLEALSCLVEALGVNMSDFFGILEKEKKTVEVSLVLNDLTELQAMLEDGRITDPETQYQRLKQKLSQMFPEFQEDAKIHQDRSHQDS